MEYTMENDTNTLEVPANSTEDFDTPVGSLVGIATMLALTDQQKKVGREETETPTATCLPIASLYTFI